MIYPWHTQAWQRTTQAYHDQRLGHTLLASGAAGIGKRAFVWHLAEWLLCNQPKSDGACGACDSCQWLAAKTHPYLHSLHAPKMDEIRTLWQNLGSTGRQVVVIDGVDDLGVSVGNALLKMLEEPSSGVYFLLISDNPSAIMPTIKSRTQNLALDKIDPSICMEFVQEHLGEQGALFLALAQSAPLAALELLECAWVGERLLWLKTLHALREGKKSVVQASDYWQKTLPLSEFMTLSLVMTTECLRAALGLTRVHSDLEDKWFLGLKTADLLLLQEVLLESTQAAKQNVQEKLIYDHLLYAFTKTAT